MSNTRIFAPAFKKHEIIEQRKRDSKKSRIPFDKKLQRCIFAILQKISSYNTEISTKNFEINFQIFFAETKKALSFATPIKNTEYQ